ncbi:M3 family metallopeptidase [Falsirhodobacter halotolerans]|uniref:M3 family metallopeptidase n=1 Tax=Falsirhodobacter halotolerans TaxID=1146892 RepID=UPI001FD29B8C|nr:M3 family metallopeptidase [Falsirhodobacter halotolerans]MCJ8138753.1 M3 family metallopeptidase [Falsirhodobacter halotolerans]
MNPLLSDWTGPFGLPPFDRITDADFAPAIDEGLAEARANIARISADPAAPTFANTIDALELSEEVLDRVAGVFYTLAGADSTDAREDLQRELAPKMSAFSSEIINNHALFDRIDTLWQARETLDLTPEQAQVLKLYHRMFVRAGAELTGAEAERLTAVKARLAVLGTQFGQNLLAEEKGWSRDLTPEDLAGLPEFVVDATRAAARDRGQAGHVLTLARSVITPFLQFSPDRDLRRVAYEAWTARGANGNAQDNRAIATEILSLREERAHLLGYASFADYKLAPEMAKTPAAVRDLLMQVWGPAKDAAARDAEVLTRMMHEDGINGDLEPWDWLYYTERRRKAEHDLDEAEIKPFFALDAMIEAAFDVSRRLFGLEFKALDLPLYHPDARAWEVTRNGKHLAVFIGDYFARPSKRSGAWCTAMRVQRKLGGDRAPIVMNVCNFAKGDPSLLSYDDARTLFHEFGHALHQMLSDVTYAYVSGTSVARDFVELPSQLYEHWLEVPEVLRTHARHVKTGAPMPEDLMERLLAAGTYDQGHSTVEYVASALVDLAFHEGAAPADPMARQAEVLAQLGMPDAIRMRHATPHFAHIFTGDGYSSGYYSYMWSEVMDADAFAAFTETGDAFDPATARALEEHILSKGGTEEAEALYTAFRGKMPDVAPLLRGRGLA